MKLVFFKNKSIEAFDQRLREAMEQLPSETAETEHYFQSFLQLKEKSKKKKRRFLWLFFFALLALLTAVYFFTTNNIQKPVHITSPQRKVEETPLTVKEPENPPVQHQASPSGNTVSGTANTVPDKGTVPDVVQKDELTTTGATKAPAASRDSAAHEDLRKKTDSLYIIW
jgi:hypothetical protein